MCVYVSGTVNVFVDSLLIKLSVYLFVHDMT